MKRAWAIANVHITSNTRTAQAARQNVRSEAGLRGRAAAPHHQGNVRGGRRHELSPMGLQSGPPCLGGSHFAVYDTTASTKVRGAPRAASLTWTEPPPLSCPQARPQAQ